MPLVPLSFGKIVEYVLTPNSTLRAGMVGSILLWLALPPLNWYWLAWFAPLPWLALVRQKSLPGRKPYRTLWLCGIVFWLLAVHWIRLPHPLNYLAWTALAMYLGAYLPAFVFLSRLGLHRYGAPLWLIAPVVWTGLEWLRGRLFTGFLMASLAHTQYRCPALIQLADIAGEYGITFFMVFMSATILEVLAAAVAPRPRKAWLRVGPLYFLRLAVPMVVAVYYGVFVEGQDAMQRSQSQRDRPRIALIQGNTPADWKMDADRQQEIMQEYWQLSLQAVKESQAADGRAPDLVVWPETTFRQSLVSTRPGYTPPAARGNESVLKLAKTYLAELVSQVGCAVLVGIDRVEMAPGEKPEESKYYWFNSSVLVDKAGQVTSTYDKMHRVPFGEYIPFADWFPFLYQLTPLTGGIVAGSGPTAMNLGPDTNISVNICYETVMPHLIGHHVAELDAKGARPDVLVNLTNDAWFWGSSELDMHLACGVFRAVETRTPLLVAANGGLSAHVDHLGNIRQVSSRQETEILLVDLDTRRRPLSLYSTLGDWLAGTCMVCCLVLICAAIAGRNASRVVPDPV